MVVALSSSPRPVDILAVWIPSAGVNSVEICDQVTTIDMATRLLKRVGTLSREDFKLVENGGKEAIELAVSMGEKGKSQKAESTANYYHISSILCTTIKGYRLFLREKLRRMQTTVS